MIHLALMMSRQGKTRLVRWYNTVSKKERSHVIRDVKNLVLLRSTRMCNVIEWKNYKIIYNRYASLYFVLLVDRMDNELLHLETIHTYVEILDRFFGNVCELDLIFNFYKAYFILDELIIDGQVQETSKKTILRIIASQDQLAEQTTELRSEI